MIELTRKREASLRFILKLVKEDVVLVEAGCKEILNKMRLEWKRSKKGKEKRTLRELSFLIKVMETDNKRMGRIIRRMKLLFKVT